MYLVVLLCLGAGVALGAPPIASESKPTPAVSEARVIEWVQTWQKRLHLDDWKIETRIVRASELKPDTLGNLKWNTPARTATIKVLNPVDYDIPASEIPEDVEYTIVHELVHLQLSALPRDLNRKDIEEQVVNRISDALMALERGPTFRARSQPLRQPSRPGVPAPAAEVVGREAAQPALAGEPAQ
jgi:hypothetical protein